jgi:hypothetical protein
VSPGLFYPQACGGGPGNEGEAVLGTSIPKTKIPHFPFIGKSCLHPIATPPGDRASRPRKKESERRRSPAHGGIPRREGPRNGWTSRQLRRFEGGRAT